MTTHTLPPPATADRLVGQRLADMPTPPEVLKLLDLAAPVGEPYRDEIERDYKLSHLYGGLEVAVRGDGADLEVLKAGTYEEVATWYETLTNGRWEQVTTLLHPDPWKLVRWRMRHA